MQPCCAPPSEVIARKEASGPDHACLVTYQTTGAAPRYHRGDAGVLAAVSTRAEKVTARELAFTPGYRDVCALLLALVGSAAMAWSSWLIDDVRYGYPRTTQVDYIVGHELDPRITTHFTAMNLNGQVLIFEVPGGDPAHARLLQGPPVVLFNKPPQESPAFEA